MRTMLTTVVALLSVSLLAQVPTRIEYGKTKELRNVKSVYLFAAGDENLAGEAQRQLSAQLPSLTFAESEEKADLTVAFTRKPAAAASDPQQFTTTVLVARATGGETVRVYCDATSNEAELGAAVTEVVEPVVSLLKSANPRTFGKPLTQPRPGQKMQVHSTAGLRPGVSKRDVVLALGYPTRVMGAPGYSQTWIYQTSDGDIRVVFGGEQIVNVTSTKKK